MACPFIRTYANPHYKALRKRWELNDISPYGELKPFHPLEWNAFMLSVPRDEAIISAPCGRCLDCRKKKASAWRIRLTKEYRDTRRMRRPIWITLQIAPRHYAFVSSDPAKAIRLFTERFRSRYGKSLKHWFIGEYGDERTKRLHFHGFVWNIPYNVTWDDLRTCWGYGYVRCELMRSEKAISYATKYCFKDVSSPDYDADSQPFSGSVWCSKGIGRTYIDNGEHWIHFQPTPDGSLPYQWYLYVDGFKYTLPKYYRDRIFSEDERKYMRLCMSMLPPPPLIYFGSYSFASKSDLIDWLHLFPKYAGINNLHLL